MRSRDEPRHGSCHPKFMLAMSGEPIQPAASYHESAILKMPECGKEGTVTRLSGEGSRVWVAIHQSEQPCLEHASR
jgi:hypothetical protein